MMTQRIFRLVVSFRRNMAREKLLICLSKSQKRFLLISALFIHFSWLCVFMKLNHPTIAQIFIICTALHPHYRRMKRLFSNRILYELCWRQHEKLHFFPEIVPLFSDRKLYQFNSVISQHTLLATISTISVQNGLQSISELKIFAQQKKCPVYNNIQTISDNPEKATYFMILHEVFLIERRSIICKIKQTIWIMKKLSRGCILLRGGGGIFETFNMLALKQTQSMR